MKRFVGLLIATILLPSLAVAQNVPFIGQGTWQACGTATASTADVAIKAAITGKYIYVTGITCKNTSATTATTLDFKSAATVISNGGISQMATTAPGSFSVQYTTPLRSAISEAFNFATNVAVTSATCCANGYIDIN